MTEEQNEPHIPKQAPTEDLQDTTADFKEEAMEYKDKYLRLLAEAENMRKRLQKEKQETTRFAIENVIADILLPMDNFENALKFAEKMTEETRNWAIGFQMILTQFKEVLHNHGIETFQSVGASFDPHQHEALEVEETEAYPEGTIILEFVKGYKSGDRIIRPARVKVAKLPSKNLDTSH